MSVRKLTRSQSKMSSANNLTGFHCSFIFMYSREIRQARAQLLDLLPNPNQNVTAVTEAMEKYISLLEGFITASEDPKATPVRPQQTGDSVDGILQESTAPSGESKLRNSVKVTWSNSLGGKNMWVVVFSFSCCSCFLEIYSGMGLQWLDCRTCKHNVVGSNPTKLIADFAMTRISTCVVFQLDHNFLICAIYNCSY